MLKFSEIFEFSKEKFRKIPILKEFEWFEWFEWFGPSPIEPFNSAPHDAEQRGGEPEEEVEGAPAWLLHRRCNRGEPRERRVRARGGEKSAPVWMPSASTRDQTRGRQDGDNLCLS